MIYLDFRFSFTLLRWLIRVAGAIEPAKLFENYSIHHSFSERLLYETLYVLGTSFRAVPDRVEGLCLPLPFPLDGHHRDRSQQCLKKALNLHETKFAR
mmetsp:Transcript_15853/g.36704  ORF Transcript_15853/g.36704 Transcript_15853/m.36704 type:complete len:98 (+) Transcript_15853:14-307(+)